MSIHLTKNYVKTETYHAKSQESSHAATSYFLIIQNTNVMHLILFIRQIFSSTCFEQQVLIFRRNSCM